GGMWAAVVVQRLDAEETRYVSDLWRVPLPLNFSRTKLFDKPIQWPAVRVIGTDGTDLGVMRTDEARKRAAELGVDLIEISPQVCRLMDWGKYRQEQSEKYLSKVRP